MVAKKRTDPGAATVRISDLARRFGVGPETVKKWVTEHGLRAYQLPGIPGYRFTQQDVDEFTQSFLTVRPPKAPPRPARAISDTDDLLTYREAADRLRVDPRTVRNYADKGWLERVTLSPQSVRVTVKSVNAFISLSIKTDEPGGA